jgi:predicted DNA-binding helix-hairpin-helix protein
MLLRVPGLGARSIDRIITTRRHHSLRLDDVARIVGSIDAVRPFIEAVDWSPGGMTDDNRLKAKLTPQAEQLSLFA